jgi:hypothetical protein
MNTDGESCSFTAGETDSCADAVVAISEKVTAKRRNCTVSRIGRHLYTLFDGGCR